jgi:hypothetical protein
MDGREVEVRVPVEASIFLHHAQTGPGAQPGLLSDGYLMLFLRG